MPYITPEKAITDGIYARLTDATDGITVAAGKYCADVGGIVKWQGEVALTTESLVQWGLAGIGTGTSPIVLIVTGGSVDYEQDHMRVAIGEFSVQIIIACRHVRDIAETADGDLGADARSPGIWTIRDDILDRLLNYGIVTDEDPPWVVGGRILRAEEKFILYELDMKIRIGREYALTAYDDEDDVEGVDTALQQIGETDDGIEVEVKNDLP
jgi:hypothetical protein